MRSMLITFEKLPFVRKSFLFRDLLFFTKSVCKIVNKQVSLISQVRVLSWYKKALLRGKMRFKNQSRNNVYIIILTDFNGLR